MLLLTVLILNLLACFGYTTYVKIKNPQIRSISESYYYNKPFMGWCFGIGFTLLPIWLEISPEPFQFLAFLSCAFFIFLGTFPKYKTDQKIQHRVCAGSLTALGLIWVAVLQHWELLGASIGAAIVELIADVDLYWLEITGFVCLYIGLLLTLL